LETQEWAKGLEYQEDPREFNKTLGGYRSNSFDGVGLRAFS